MGKKKSTVTEEDSSLGDGVWRSRTAFCPFSKTDVNTGPRINGVLAYKHLVIYYYGLKHPTLPGLFFKVVVQAMYFVFN